MAERLMSYNCKICNISCCGPENLTQHFASAKHKKKAQQATMFGDTPSSSLSAEVQASATPVAPSIAAYNCEVCQTVMTGIESYTTHMQGARHQKNLRKIDAVKKLKEEGSLPGSSSPSSQADTSSQKDSELDSLSERLATLPVVSGTSYHYCSVCQVPMSGPESLGQHYKGIKHAKNVKRLQAISSLNSSGALTAAFNGIASQPGNKSATEAAHFTEIEADQNVTEILRDAYDNGEKDITNNEEED